MQSHSHVLTAELLLSGWTIRQLDFPLLALRPTLRNAADLYLAPYNLFDVVSTV